MKMVAPLMSQEKAAFVRRQFLSTLLGGVVLSPEMTARAFLAQGVLWALPPVLAAVAAAAMGEPVWARCGAGAALGAALSAAVELGRWAVCRRSAGRSDSPSHAAWFADYDDVDFSSLLEPATCRVLLPPKRSKLHLVLSLVLSAALVGAAAGALDYASVEEDLGEGESTAAVVLSLFCLLALASAHYGLVAAPPVEATAHRYHDPRTVSGLVADFSRPLLLLVLLLPTLAELRRPLGALLRIVAALLPPLWATGIVPQLDTLGAWVLEQAEVHLFGGSPLPLGGAAFVGEARLFLGALGSTAAAAAVALAAAAVRDANSDERGIAEGVRDANSDELPGLLAMALGLPLALVLAALPPRLSDFGRQLLVGAGLAGLQVAVGLALGVALLLGLGKDAVQASLAVDRAEAETAWLIRLAMEQVAVGLCYVALYAVSAWRLRADVGALGLGANGHVYRMERHRALAKDPAPRVARTYAILEAPVRIILLAHMAGYGAVVFCQGGDARGALGDALEAAALLRAWRVVLCSPPRAAVDAWLVGILDLVLVSAGAQASSGYLSWSLGTRLMLVSVVRGRLKRLFAYVHYAFHLSYITAVAPKLRHPLTNAVLMVDVAFLPMVVLTLLLAAALESPLVALFTMPIFAVGYPRSAHGHPELSAAGQPLTKGVEGIFYSILAPSLLRGMAPRWRCGALSAQPGATFFCRSHERLACVVRVLGAGLGWVQVELRGLEMQEPTSCHHVEAGKIDDAFAAAFEGTAARAGANRPRPGDEDREDGRDEAEAAALQGAFALRPVCEVFAKGYEQTQLSLRGIIDNPETLRQVHRLFLKTLVWVMAKECGRKGGRVPARWLDCRLKPRDSQRVKEMLKEGAFPRHLTELLNHRAGTPMAPAVKLVGPGEFEERPEQDVDATSCMSLEGTPRSSDGCGDSEEEEEEEGPWKVAPAPARGTPSQQWNAGADLERGSPAVAYQRSLSGSPPVPPGTPPTVPPGTPPMGTRIRMQARASPSPPPQVDAASCFADPFEREPRGAGVDHELERPLFREPAPRPFDETPNGRDPFGALGSPAPPALPEEEDNLDALMDMLCDMAPASPSTSKVAPALERTSVPEEAQPEACREPPPPKKQPPALKEARVKASSRGKPRQLTPLASRRTKGAALGPAMQSKVLVARPASEEAEPLGDLAKLVTQAYTAVDIAPTCGRLPEDMGSSHVFQIFTGQLLDKTPEAMAAGPEELRWLAEVEEVRAMTLKAFRYALKVAVDCVAMADDALALEYSELDEALQELESDWHLADESAPSWQASMEKQVPNLMALRKKGTDVQILRLCLHEDNVRVGELRSEVVQSIWASESLELRYFTNDDDERYSIQAHPTLFRNMIVQSAEYPIYVSPPTTLWL